MPKKAENSESNQDNAAPVVDPQKQYLLDQFGGLMDQVGDGFGGPLQEELIRRLEQTISDFHEEVSEMLTDLKESSEKRQERLKQIWDNPDPNTSDGGGEGTDEEFIPGGGKKEDSGGGDVSEWEKRLESMDPGDASGKGPGQTEDEEKPKKKKGLFGLGKK